MKIQVSTKIWFYSWLYVLLTVVRSLADMCLTQISDYFDAEAACRRCPGGRTGCQGGQDPQEARHKLQQNRNAAKSPPRTTIKANQ